MANLALFYSVTDYGALGDGVTDDTVAIQAAIQACFDGGGGTVYFPDTGSDYIIGGALQTSISGQNPNCQLYIPQMASSSALNTTIRLLGETVPNKLINTGTGIDVKTTGVILKSTILGSGTRPRVLGSVKSAADNFNYCGCVAENIRIRVRSKTTGADHEPALTAFGMGHSYDFCATNCIADIETRIYDSVEPTTNTRIGFEMPFINNTGAAGNTLKECIAQGFYKGFELSDHSRMFGCMTYGCLRGVSLTASSQPILLIGTHLFNNKYDLVFEGACPVETYALGLESGADATRWYYTTYNFYAPSNVVAFGLVRYIKSSFHTISGTSTAFGNVMFQRTQGSGRVTAIGGISYPNYGGTGEWNGQIDSSGKAIFQIGDGQNSSGEDGLFTDFILSHGQTGGGTAIVARHLIMNSGTGAAEKRLVSWNYSTSGGNQIGKVECFVGNGGGVNSTLEFTSSYFKTLRPNIIDSDISPAALAANTDNYAPTNIATAATLRISASSAVDLTGIAGGVTMIDGRELTLINVGTTNTITLKNDVTSTAANRFLLNADFALAANMACKLVYDGTSSRWRKIY